MPIRNSSPKPYIDVFALLLPEIRELLTKKDFTQLKEIFKKINSIDLSVGFKYLNNQEKILVFRLLSARKAIEVFEDLSVENQKFLLDNLQNQEVVPILNEMAPDERTKLFKEFSPKIKNKIFGLLKKEQEDDVRRLLSYKEGTAGSIMNTEFVELKKDMTARQAILTLQEKLRTETSRAIYSVYITDESHHLLGGMSLQSLLTAPPDILIKEIMSDTSFIKVNVNMDKEEVGKWVKRYDLLDVPVVDEQDILLGIVTIDDIMDVVEEEATEDIHKTASVSPLRMSYQSAGIWLLYRKRILWLVGLVFLNLFSSAVIAAFKEVLASSLALAFFIPLLTGSGGNTGSQSATLMIRALVTGDVKLSEWIKVLVKELLIGIILGISLGLAGWMLGFFRGGFKIGLIVGLTMFSIIVVSNLIGLLLPFILTKFKLDPAVASNPLITSIVDSIGLLLYFFIAARIL